MDFAGRKALVTGSATGLGRSIALKLAEGGADVIVNASRSAEEAEKTAAEIRALGREAVVAIADVSDRQGAEALARAAAPWGRLDILVNNAGITRHAPDYADLDALSAQDFHDVYGVNVVGPWLVMQACKDLLMKTHEETGRPAAVLNTSSIASMRPVGSSIAYAASKAALNAVTLYLARGLAPAVRVNAVCPGFIGTRWFKDAMDADAYQRTEDRIRAVTPLQAASGPDDIADAAIFFLSDAARHVTGETLFVDAGLHMGPTVQRG